METKNIAESSKHPFRKAAEKISSNALKNFTKIVHSYFYFHFGFITLILSEVLVLVTFFNWLSESAFLAIILAMLFLSFFSYFILRLYLQARKSEQLTVLKKQFLNNLKPHINYQEDSSEYHIAKASLCIKLQASLKDQEYKLLPYPAWLDTISSTMEKLSCFCFWQDVHYMRESLLLQAIQEYLKLVKKEPTNMEIHAALANTYVTLSQIYSDPKTKDDPDSERWVPPQKFSSKMRRQFRSTAERAIEEFKILNDYAPNDPWVHIQLAYSYQDLGMPKEEIKEYEIILNLRPNDEETLFKLGVLYFKQGLNSKGLNLYEQLKNINGQKAEDLIKFYGSYTHLD